MVVEVSPRPPHPPRPQNPPPQKPGPQNPRPQKLNIGDQAKRWVEAFKKGGDVTTAKDGQEVHGTVGSLEAVELRHREVEDPSVEEEERAEAVVLGGRGGATFDREVVEESGDLRRRDRAGGGWHGRR